MIVVPQSTQNFAKREAGGKGYNLYILSRAGLPVPKWVTLGTSVFQKFLEETGLKSRIGQALQNIESASAAEVSNQISNWIKQTSYPAGIEAEVREAYALVKDKPIAVRSSGADEDSAKFSFAGQLNTYLYVRTEEEALKFVKECWASGYSERGLSYRLHNGILDANRIRVAVVLQQMLDCEKSGVLFTCDPIKGDTKDLVINSVYGLGEGLVSGLIEGDIFTVEKATGMMVNSVIVEKEKQLVRHASGSGTAEVGVDLALKNEPSLNLPEIQKLNDLGKTVEALYRYPQDVEWGYEAGQFYLLQARPVTTPIKNEEGLLYIWDNSNIVESYGGITLPLTFSFARHVYHWVYIQFCEILLVPQKEIRRMDYFLRNMLGLFYGRVFYNILNWYKLTSILPGFKYNSSFMETMMGTQHSLADEIADRIKPPGFQEKLSSKVMRFVTGLKFLYFHFTIQKVVDRFLVYFHSVYDQYRKIDFYQLSVNEIHQLYQELEEKLLMEWKAPIINDYLCMVHFGLLKKLTAKWFGGLGESASGTLQNDLLCGEGNLESAEPTFELIRMAKLIADHLALKALVDQTSSENMAEVLQRTTGIPGLEEFKSRVQRYIDLYGFRCMNEMKLEEIDLYQDPAFLFTCLKNYLRSGQIDLDQYKKREHEIRAAAEKKVHEHLRGPKKLVYLWSLKNARLAVKNRENTRFCRTRIYGVARAMFFAIGRDFALRSIISSQEDIFYLHIEEIFGALEGTLTVQNLNALVALRKKEYQSYEAIEPSSRFHTRGSVYWQNDHSPELQVPGAETFHLEPHQLKGTGCCPGTVEGVVKVIMSPKDDMQLNGEILVTMRTDPGWIPLYPAASGLLVERGGLLSHSAIVAREMGLPTVVGVNGLTKRLKTGMRIQFNGETGVINILDEMKSMDSITAQVSEKPAEANL